MYIIYKYIYDQKCVFNIFVSTNTHYSKGFKVLLMFVCVYIYIHTHTHTHTHIYIKKPLKNQLKLLNTPYASFFNCVVTDFV